MLGTELVTRLAAFAKTGRPEAENLAPWSPFDGSSLYRIDAGVMQEVYPLTRIYINLEEFLLRELGALDKFFYYTSSGQGVTMDIRVTLTFKAPVNHQALLTAADEALRLFPEFSVQTVLKGSKLFYEESHNHAALLPSGTGYDFGTDDMNGYLFCFQADSAKPNEVVFSAYHGLSDWNGLRRFLKTIVCRYAVHVKGLPDDYFSGVIRSKAPEKNEWFNEANLNPYEFYARQDAVPSYKPEISGEIFTLPEENYSFDSPASRHIRITLSVSQFLKAAKSRNTSFVPYLLYLASNAVREAYSTDKNIFLALPTNQKTSSMQILS